MLDVIYSISKSGYIKPRVRIEPVNLGGVTIEYATAFNGKFIEDNKIGVGAIIEIIRSGDVIPHILEVLQPANKTKLPKEDYYWTDNNIDIVLKDTNNDLVKEKIITKFFREINVAGMNIGTVKLLIENKYDEIHKIINMTLENLLTIPMFKDKKANKIYNNIQTSIQKATLLDIMAASNIFGRGLGYKKLEIIINTYPDILTLDLSDKEKIEKLISIDGIQVKTAQNFIDNINDFKEFLTKCNLLYKLNENIIENQSRNPSRTNFHHRL